MNLTMARPRPDFGKTSSKDSVSWPRQRCTAAREVQVEETLRVKVGGKAFSFEVLSYAPPPRRAEADAPLPPNPSGVGIGQRLQVYWPLDHEYYEGTVADVSAGRYLVQYIDGEAEWVNLSDPAELWAKM